MLNVSFTFLAVFGALLAAAVIALSLRAHRLRTRSRLLAEVMDLADAQERELKECRARLRELPALTASVAPGGALAAHSTLASEPLVQAGLRDLLAHRLWLRDHADRASLPELRAARDALAEARSSLAHELERLADVRSDLATSLDDLALASRPHP